MFNFGLDNEGSVSQIAAVLAQASHRHKTFDKSLPPPLHFYIFLENEPTLNKTGLLSASRPRPYDDGNQKIKTPIGFMS